MIKTITSTQNPQIKQIQKLHNSKDRHEQKKFLAEGLRICSTLINAGASLEQLYFTQELQEDALRLEDKKITLVSAKIMKKISPVKSPSGLLGVFKIPEKPSIKNLTSGIVLLQFADPGNIGTLIRTAAAMSVKAVVIIEGADIWSPKVIQSSAGTIAQVNIFELSWQELIKNKGKLKLCALVVENGQSPEKVDFRNSLLIVGNEAHGIPQNLLDQCDEKITLPMSSNVESLNAAVAGSIALYLAFVKR